MLYFLIKADTSNAIWAEISNILRQRLIDEGIVIVIGFYVSNKTSSATNFVADFVASCSINSR